MTIIVNLFGAPCAGKSTVRADIFRTLKQAGINCEEVYETAKKLSWTKRTGELGCQPYIFGKQLRDMEILVGKVDVIVTDSPLVLSEFYNRKYRPGVYPEAFGRLVIDHFKAMGGFNYFLTRVGSYQQSGRNQDESEADMIGLELLALLDENRITYQQMPGDVKAGPRIANFIIKQL